MGYLAIVLAVYLFYRYVERKHKIAVIWVLGMMSCIGVCAVGNSPAPSQKQEQDQKSVSVRFIKMEQLVDKKKKPPMRKLIVEVCNNHGNSLLGCSFRISG